MENNNYKVYMLTSPYGKKYIGVTGQNPERRWRKGKDYKSNKELINDIKEYGWDNFRHEVIYESLTKKDGARRERILILLYNTADVNFGYNHTTGGYGTPGYRHSDDAKNSIRNSKIGKQFSEDHKKNMSKVKSGENNPMYRKLGAEHHNSKSIICITTGEIYGSAGDAERKTGIPHGNITRCCQGKRKYAGKSLITGRELVWRYYFE